MLWKRLARLGMSKRLEKAGAAVGDLVRVGEVEMPWR